jgi:hypothetical protein
MTARQITAALAALAVGAGAGAGCGGNSGGRESREQGNQGEIEPQGGGPATQAEPGPSTLGATGETPPTVTQESSGGG